LTPDLFRNAYLEAFAAGFTGTRAEFATLVLGCPSLFRGAVVAGARSWQAERSNRVPPSVRSGALNIVPIGRRG